MARRGVAGKGKGTHRDERETAARGDGNVGVVELGAGADAVAEAPGLASAGDRGGLSSGDVDTPDQLAVGLRCIQGCAERGGATAGHLYRANCAA